MNERFGDLSMDPSDFLAGVDSSRREVLSTIHDMIIRTDGKVSRGMGNILGKQMIIYKGVRDFQIWPVELEILHVIHVMPMYGSRALHSRYAKQLNKAKFQKACINFRSGDELPLNI
jgi:hypothetical protein